MSTTLSDRSARRARIVFDTFRSAYDPRLAAWLLFRSVLVPGLAAAPVTVAPAVDEGSAVPLGVFGVWRLLASNNRELARGVAVLPSPLDAVEAARTAAASVSRMTPAPVRGREPTRHSWVLRLEDEPTVMSARWYESAGEAAMAARAAAAALATAEIVPGVSIGTASGRRSRRTLSAT